MIKVKVAVSGYVLGTWVDYSGVSDVKIHNSHPDLNKIYRLSTEIWNGTP